MNDQAQALGAQLAAIDAKLDRITEELEVMRRHRRELEELRDDLARVGKDLFQTAIEELEDVAPFVQSGDFVHLLKRLVRNTNNIAQLVSRVEGAVDFMEDAKPLGKELFNDLLNRLNEMDHKGYFGFADEMMRVMDNVVTHFSREDVRLLADNVVAILETVKGLTQPEMLDAVNNAVTVYQKLDFETVEEYSPWKAFRELRKPEMRRGLGFLITFLRNLSAHAPSKTTSVHSS